MPLIRSISGLRGTIGDSLTPEVVTRYSAAFARHCGPGTIVLGNDGRPSGEWIAGVALGTLLACGMDVRVIGVAPTPTVQLAVEHSDAVGGISITASHNPSEWNGLKFLNREGVFPGPSECERLFALVDAGDLPLASWENVGRRFDDSGMLDRHIRQATALPFVDIENLRRRKFRVVVDAVNAAGSQIVPALLQELGCDVVELFCDGSGRFPHTPEPLPQNLTALARAVASERADIGIAVDPDADRLVLIDERGTPFGEEYTITQAVDFILGRERQGNPETPGTVAVNLSTTRAVDDVAARYGARVVRTPVGEINVVEGMKASGAVIGGEGSGGVILPALHYGRDSLVGIVITLQNLLDHGGPLSALRAELPEYFIVKKKAPLPEGSSADEIFRKVEQQEGADANVTKGDGVKFDYEQSWVHLRASNTEPIVRVIAEAPTETAAEALAARMMKQVTG